MKLLKCTLFLLTFGFIFSDCKKTEEDFVEKSYATTIDYFNLEVGQKSFFTSYQTTCLDYSLVEWTKDTLLVEVTNFEDGVFTFKESFTSGSVSVKDLPQPPEPVEISVIFENDYILLPDRFASQLFWFYGNDTLFLQPTEMVDLVQQDCELILENDPFIGNDIGAVEHFQIDDILIQNKNAVSCVPPFLEVDAYLIYQDKNLLASHVIQNGTVVRGWVQLELQ